MKYIISAIFTFFMIFCTYDRGLFFDRDFYIYQVILFTVTLVFILYSWITKTIRLTMQGLIPLGTALAYVPPLFFSAESVKGTMDELLRWGSYGCFFYLLYSFAQKREHRDLLPWGLSMIGLFILMGAWLGFYDLLHFPDIVVEYQDNRLSSLGVRLSGFFQYANTFAAVLGMFWIYHLIELTKGNNRSATILLSFPLVLYGTAFLLTESRGAWLVFVLSWLGGLWVLRIKDQLQYTLLSIWSGGISLFVYRQITATFNQSDFPGLTYLIALSLVTPFILILIKNSIQALKIDEGRHWIHILFPFSAFTLTVMIGLDLAYHGLFYQLLPATLQDRIDLSNLDTILARKMFYSDAVAMWKDSPLIGYGGDAWRLLVYRYQKELYVGSEVHNGYLDLLIEVGLTGVLIFLAVGFLFLRTNSIDKKAFPYLLMILGHSLLDFDLSYGFVWFLLVWITIMNITHEGSLRSSPKKGIPTFLGIGMMGLLAFTVLAFRFEMSSIAYEKYVQSLHHKQWLTEAMKWNPWETETRIQFARDAHDAPAIKAETLEKVYPFEPRNPALLWQMGVAYAELNQNDLFLTFTDQALRMDPYNRHRWEAYLQILFEKSRMYQELGNHYAVGKMAEKTIQVFESYRQLAEDFQRSGKINDRDFRITPEAQAYYTEAFRFLR